MKDFYYILGIKDNAPQQEIKQAYKKLALKFHPDKNEGDVFFTERFKEIQEAYETLNDPLKRHTYDLQRLNKQSNGKTYDHAIFSPLIEYFQSNKHSFEYNEEVTFTWKTMHAHKAYIKPFGPVEPTGQKTYKIKDFKHPILTFELYAESAIGGQTVKSTIKLKNLTYQEMLLHFRRIIEAEHNAHSPFSLRARLHRKKLRPKTEDSEWTPKRIRNGLILIILTILFTVGILSIINFFFPNWPQKEKLSLLSFNQSLFMLSFKFIEKNRNFNQNYKKD